MWIPDTPESPGSFPRLILVNLWTQDCGKKRSCVFHQLLADFGQSKKSEERLREERKAARKVSVYQKSALTEAQSEILRLKTELEKSKAAVTDLKACFLDATKKQKETLDSSEARAHHAETELSLLRSK